MEQPTAIDKALDVLFFLRRAGEARGVTEIGRALSLPKSSAHRLLATLARRGLVERDHGGRYRLGVGLLFLGQGVAAGEPMVAAARPILEALAEQLHETCFLVAARGGRLVVLDKVESQGVLRVSPEVGAQIPIIGTAVGKLYLAHDPEQLADDDAARTAAFELLGKAQLDATRTLGHASNYGQWIDGLCVFSVPLFAHGRLSAALAVAMPTGRRDEEAESRVLCALKEATVRVCARAEGREG